MEISLPGREAQEINGLEARLAALSSPELTAEAARLRARAARENLEALLPEAFALVREASKRTPRAGLEKHGKNCWEKIWEKIWEIYRLNYGVKKGGFLRLWRRRWSDVLLCSIFKTIVTVIINENLADSCVLIFISVYNFFHAIKGSWWFLFDRR